MLLLHQARQEGDLLASYDLSDCYEHGIAVDRDPRMASKLLQEVYESGQVMSGAFHLTRYYELGIGVEQDLEKAAALYRELKTRNTWEGKLLQVYYGMYLIRGLGVEKNVRAGLKVVRAGLKTGHGCGWAVYSDCYRHGYGVAKDVIKAVRYYSNAIAATSSAQGIVDAHFALAEMYETGEGLAHDAGRAARHYVHVADRMNRVAQWKAGTFFESSTGVESQVYRAFYYFDLSARGGFVPGQRKAG